MIDFFLMANGDTIDGLMSFLYALGMPALIGGAMWIGFKTVLVQIGALKKGTQASLRNSLVQLWEKYSELGYAPVWVRDDFENMYVQYHNLGANGVIDDLREKFLALPTEPSKKTKNKGE